MKELGVSTISYTCMKIRGQNATLILKISSKTQDQDIAECTLLINKIKEHMHNKTDRQIDNFNKSVQKARWILS